jgi:hypothetical protein
LSCATQKVEATSSVNTTVGCFIRSSIHE